MTDKTQGRINQCSGPLVGVSWLVLLVVLSPGMIVCGPGAEAGQLKFRLLAALLSIPGLLLGILSTRLFDRLLAWVGWLAILWLCWADYRQIFP